MNEVELKQAKNNPHALVTLPTSIHRRHFYPGNDALASGHFVQAVLRGCPRVSFFSQPAATGLN